MSGITFDDLDKAGSGQVRPWVQDRSCYDWTKPIIAGICNKVEINWQGPRGAECFLMGHFQGARHSFCLQHWVLGKYISDCFVQKSYDTPKKRMEIFDSFKKVINHA
jgi:hypothetical protein